MLTRNTVNLSLFFFCLKQIYLVLERGHVIQCWHAFFNLCIIFLYWHSHTPTSKHCHSEQQWNTDKSKFDKRKEKKITKHSNSIQTQIKADAEENREQVFTVDRRATAPVLTKKKREKNILQQGRSWKGTATQRSRYQLNNQDTQTSPNMTRHKIRYEIYKKITRLKK